ncbi:MAG: NUDIX hydrolase [Planctomycetota bacterium]|jgi:8-oxo-dGTP diphosphatase
MPYCPIVGTLAYIISPDKSKVLLVHRNARETDDHIGKYNGVGGKMEPGEDVMACIKREIKEETNICADKIVLKGTVNWTGFGNNAENWLGFIFRVDSFSGTPYKSNEEGDLVWVDIAEIYNLPMWEGDRHFLPMIFDDNPDIFHGYMPYNNDRPLDWKFHR